MPIVSLRANTTPTLTPTTLKPTKSFSNDPEKRKKYDQYGENWQHAEAYEQAKQQQSRQQQNYTGGSGGHGFDYEDFGQGGGDFSEFFQSMFGGAAGGAGSSRGGRGRQGGYRGQDYNAELHLSLHDVAESNKQTLTVNGKNIRITIPAGVENGQTIKITGHGGPGANGGPAGDLFITFQVANDTNFKREGSNLYAIVKLNLYTAILGGEITADTLTGKVKLKVKPETQNGTKVKLKGKGMPVYKKDGEFGDLYLTYEIELPTNLTEKQKQLFEELAKS